MAQMITVRTEYDLRTAVGKAVEAIRWPGLKLTTRPANSTDGVDLWLEASLDRREFRFGVECRLRPTVREVGVAKEQTGKTLALLAAVHLPKPLRQHCQEEGVSYLDLNGHLFLRGPGLLVGNHEPGEKRFRTAEPERNLFAGKSSRLARAFLSFPGQTWTQGDLVRLTGCSAGLVSRLLREHLVPLGWVSGMPHAHQWMRAMNFRQRTTRVPVRTFINPTSLNLRCPTPPAPFPTTLPAPGMWTTTASACGLCESVAPAVFRLSDDGSHNVVHRQPAAADDLLDAEDARDRCPVDAIGRDRS